MFRLIAAAVLPFAAIVCAQGQEPAVSEAEEPVVVSEDAAANPVDVDSDAIPPVLDLATAERITLRDNPSLRASDRRVAQALARVTQARSEYFPQLGATGSAQVTELSDQTVHDLQDAITDGQFLRILQIVSGADPAVPGSVTGAAQAVTSTILGVRRGLNAIDDTNEGYFATLDATWLLFDGFGRKFRNAIGRYGALEFEASYHESQRLLLSAVAAAYYTVQLARENIAIAEADEGFNRRQLNEAEARRRVGTGSLGDVLNFEIRVKAAQSAVLASQRSYEVARIGLAELLGMPQTDGHPTFEVEPLISEQPEEMQLPAAEPLILVALENRPDIIQSRFAVERAGAAVGARRSAYYPRIDAFASRDAFRNDDLKFNEDDFSSTIGVVLNYEIFTGGRRKGQLKEAKAAREEAEFLSDSTAYGVAADVRISRENLNTSQQELILQRATTGFVERNLELAERGYNEGQESLVRLNEAQRDLIAQRSRLALALVALRLSWHDLRTSTAETLAPYLPAPDEIMVEVE